MEDRFKTSSLDTGEPKRPVTLRAATPGDSDAIVRLVQETISSVYPRYYPDAAVDAFIELHSAAAISADVAAGKVMVAESAGGIVGTGTFDGQHISRLFVAASLQSRGIGSALLDRLESEIARSSDVAVLESSLPACSLYERRGYRTVSRGTWEVPSGSALSSFLVWEVMEKAL